MGRCRRTPSHRGHGRNSQTPRYRWVERRRTGPRTRGRHDACWIRDVMRRGSPRTPGRRRPGGGAPEAPVEDREEMDGAREGRREKGCGDPGDQGGKKTRRGAGLETARKGVSGKGRRRKTRDAPSRQRRAGEPRRGKHRRQSASGKDAPREWTRRTDRDEREDGGAARKRCRSGPQRRLQAGASAPLRTIRACPVRAKAGTRRQRGPERKKRGSPEDRGEERRAAGRASPRPRKARAEKRCASERGTQRQRLNKHASERGWEGKRRGGREGNAAEGARSMTTSSRRRECWHAGGRNTPRNEGDDFAPSGS